MYIKKAVVAGCLNIVGNETEFDCILNLIDKV